jgi:hypothetical protein
MVLPNVERTKSYWIEAAESDLKHFRSTQSLPLETDVVIIGSGYAGATTAYHIHKVCGSSNYSTRQEHGRLTLNSLVYISKWHNPKHASTRSA